MNRVLVTGATGHVGRPLVDALCARSMDVVAGVRDVSSASARFPERVRSVRFDFRNRETWPAALDGVGRLFLMRPPAIADVRDTLVPLIDEASRRGVEHVVFLSVAGAGRNKLVPHRAVEDHLRSRSEAFTNLRPGFFAQNLGSAYRRDIVEDDRIFVPAGRRQPVNWIDARDIAEVAALILDSPVDHRGASYTLTGPGAVPWRVVTDALTEVLGRPIRYEPASIVGYVRHLRRRGLPMGAIAVQTILHAGLRFGHGAGYDPTLERLLGRPATPVRAYVSEHAETWSARETRGAGRDSASELEPMDT